MKTIRIFKVENNTDFKPHTFAEGVIFSNNVSVVLLKRCNSPFLVQNEFNEEEVLEYIKHNSYLNLPTILSNLKLKFITP